MRVLFFITGLGMGGAEKVVCELADRLYERGIQVHIIYFVGDIIKRPMHPIGITKVPFTKDYKNFFSLVKLLQFIRDFKPDVIHAHMFHANILARLVKLFNKNMKVICSSHSNFEGGKLRMNLYRWTENLCDYHTNVTDNAAQALMQSKAVKNKKIITIYNGIDSKKYNYSHELRKATRHQLQINDDIQVIMSIGRIDTPKDYPNLLTAFSKIYRENHNTLLLIIGDGPKKTELEKLATSLGIQQSVRFLGIRNDVPALLNACDIFVSSSAWEGFGIAILEAMLCQRPIIATKTDGAKELLDAKYLVDINDSSMLANKILETLNKKIDNVEYEDINNFDWSRVIEDWLRLYK